MFPKLRELVVLAVQALQRMAAGRRRAGFAIPLDSPLAGLQFGQLRPRAAGGLHASRAGRRRAGRGRLGRQVLGDRLLHRPLGTLGLLVDGLAVHDALVDGEHLLREGQGEEQDEPPQAALSFLIGRTLSAETISAISFWMKRAVIGVPSKCRMEMSEAGLMPASLTSSVLSCASRFCSTTNTLVCEATKSKISSWNGKARMRSALMKMSFFASASSASCMEGLVLP